MEKHERIERSPLRHMEKVQNNGKQAHGSKRKVYENQELTGVVFGPGTIDTVGVLLRLRVANGMRRSRSQGLHPARSGDE
jgi:hypothetical protein